MDIEFTVMLLSVPNRWRDPLVACNAIKVWDETNLQNLGKSYSVTKFVIGTHNPDNRR